MVATRTCRPGGNRLRFLWMGLALVIFATCTFAQESSVSSALAPSGSTPHESSGGGSLPANPEPAPSAASASASGSSQPVVKPATPGVVAPEKQQPKRILGMMPNFRAVSAGELPPPPTPKQAFVIATKNSFDYSSVVFVGLTSAFAEWSNAHPQLGEGMTGYGRYYWRGFVDKTDGNYLVIFALPTDLPSGRALLRQGRRRIPQAHRLCDFAHSDYPQV